MSSQAALIKLPIVIREWGLSWTLPGRPRYTHPPMGPFRYGRAESFTTPPILFDKVRLPSKEWTLHKKQDIPKFFRKGLSKLINENIMFQC
jgi:hypothetical protein